MQGMVRDGNASLADKKGVRWSEDLGDLFHLSRMKSLVLFHNAKAAPDFTLAPSCFILIFQAPATIVVRSWVCQNVALVTSDHHNLRPGAASNAPSASQLASHLKNARSKRYIHTHTHIYI